MKNERRSYHQGPGSRRHIRLPFGLKVRRASVLGGLGLLGATAAFLGLSAALLFEDAVQDRQRLASAGAAFVPSSGEAPAAEPAGETDATHWAASLDELREQPAHRGNDDPELRRILDAHVKAMGGWANWSRVQSLRLTGTIDRDGQLVDFCIIKKRPNQIRATLTLRIPGKDDEKLQVIRAHDGKHAWTATRLAGDQELTRKDLDERGARDLHADAGVFPPLLKLWQEGAPFELLENSFIDGQETIVLRAKAEGPDPSGTITFHLSPEDYRTLRIIKKAGDSSVVTSFFHYQRTEGVMLPSETVIDSPLTGRTTLRTQSVEVGVGIHKEYFGPQTATASLRP